MSTKIVIFASDGLIHFAGDGILAGVINKNEQVCRLNENGEYMAALDMDYPSLEEIYRALLRNKVIFMKRQKKMDEIHRCDNILNHSFSIVD